MPDDLARWLEARSVDAEVVILRGAIAAGRPGLQVLSIGPPYTLTALLGRGVVADIRG